MSISRNLHIKCRPDSLKTFWNCWVKIEVMTKGTGGKKKVESISNIFFSDKRKGITEEAVQSIRKMGVPGVPLQLRCENE